MAHRQYPITAAVCLGIAAVFRFALVGYGVLALCFLGLACFTMLLWYCARRGLKKIRLALWSLLVLALCALATVEIPILRAARTAPDPVADYAIVLGAGYKIVSDFQELPISLR